MPTFVTSNERQLTNSDPDGTLMGNSASDPIAFYGNTPIVQPSGNSQAAVARGQAAGVVATFSSTQSPASVAVNTTAEVSFTVQTGTGAAFVAASGDIVFLNKPTSQAGLGVGNARYSSANTLGVTFSNLTASIITPTGSELYSGVIIRGFLNFTQTLSPASVAANTTAEQIFTITPSATANGVRVGNLIHVVKPTAQAGLDIVGMRVVGNNQIGITFLNNTASVITPTPSQAYQIISLAGIDAISNYITGQINIASALSAGVATITTSEIASLVVTGLAVTDTVIGVTKNTTQAGLGIAGWRVTAANSLAITWVNPTAATLTPTATQVYGFTLMRPNPAAPLLLYSAALAPVSVAANTTAEQTFTVTGLVAASPVWVNKPSFQAGLGIAGVRVSGANTLAINFCNATAAAITPTAETYTVGNFQLPYNSADGVCLMQSAAQQMSLSTSQGNGIRAALASLGAIAGA